MGHRPGEVRDMAVPEFLAAYDGFAAFHGAKPVTEYATRADLASLMEQFPDG